MTQPQQYQQQPYPQGQPPYFPPQQPVKRSSGCMKILAVALVGFVGLIVVTCYFGMKRVEEVRETDRIATEKADQSILATVERAKSLYAEGKLEEAVRELEGAAGNTSGSNDVRMQAHRLLDEYGREYGKQFEPKVAELIASAETSLAAGDADTAEKHLKEAIALRYAPNADAASKLLALVIEARSEAKMKSFVLAMSDDEFAAFRTDLVLPERPAFERNDVDAVFKKSLKLNHDKAVSWRAGSDRPTPIEKPNGSKTAVPSDAEWHRQRDAEVAKYASALGIVAEGFARGLNEDRRLAFSTDIKSIAACNETELAALIDTDLATWLNAFNEHLDRCSVGEEGCLPIVEASHDAQRVLADKESEGVVRILILKPTGDGDVFQGNDAFAESWVVVVTTTQRPRQFAGTARLAALDGRFVRDGDFVGTNAFGARVKHPKYVDPPTVEQDKFREFDGKVLGAMASFDKAVEAAAKPFLKSYVERYAAAITRLRALHADIAAKYSESAHANLLARSIADRTDALSTLLKSLEVSATSPAELGAAMAAAEKQLAIDIEQYRVELQTGVDEVSSRLAKIAARLDKLDIGEYTKVPTEETAAFLKAVAGSKPTKDAVAAFDTVATDRREKLLAETVSLAKTYLASHRAPTFSTLVVAEKSDVKGEFRLYLKDATGKTVVTCSEVLEWILEGNELRILSGPRGGELVTIWNLAERKQTATHRFIRKEDRDDAKKKKIPSPEDIRKLIDAKAAAAAKGETTIPSVAWAIEELPVAVGSVQRLGAVIATGKAGKKCWYFSADSENKDRDELRAVNDRGMISEVDGKLYFGQNTIYVLDMKE